MLIFTTSLTVEALRKEAERRLIWQKIDGVIPMKPVNLNRFSKALDRHWEQKDTRKCKKCKTICHISEMRHRFGRNGYFCPECCDSGPVIKPRRPPNSLGRRQNFIKCSQCREKFRRKEEGYEKGQYRLCPKCMTRMKVKRMRVK